MKKIKLLLTCLMMAFVFTGLVGCENTNSDETSKNPVVTFRTTAERKLGEKEAINGKVDPTGIGGTPKDGWMFRWETGERKTNDKGEETLVLSGTPFDFDNVTKDITVYQRIVPEPGVARMFIAGGYSEGGPGWDPSKLEEGNEWLMSYDVEKEVYTQTLTFTEKGGFRVLDNTGEWNSLYNATHVTEVTISDDVKNQDADYFPEIKLGEMGTPESGKPALFYAGGAGDYNVEVNIAIKKLVVVVSVDVLNNTMTLHVTELELEDSDNVTINTSTINNSECVQTEINDNYKVGVLNNNHVELPFNNVSTKAIIK